MSLELSSNESEDNFRDELVDISGQVSKKPINIDSRQVRLILDHTAFVRGIGNIKRWFNEEYINSNTTRSNEIINLNIYIPTYTLHEFDFVKRAHL